MTTLFDYLSWRGDLPLSADPFHEVDGVILARFTYMPFHRVLRRDSLTPTTVEAVCRALLALPEKYFLLNPGLDYPKAVAYMARLVYPESAHE